MYAKVREHGAPVQGARLGGKPEKRRTKMTANPRNRAKVVHFSFNSPSASQLLLMNKK
jgi:hypothetical protein